MEHRRLEKPSACKLVLVRKRVVTLPACTREPAHKQQFGCTQEVQERRKWPELGKWSLALERQLDQLDHALQERHCSQVFQQVQLGRRGRRGQLGQLGQGRRYSQVGPVYLEVQLDQLGH